MPMTETNVHEALKTSTGAILAVPFAKSGLAG